jgi:single-strand DNA-binding protein
MINKVILVGNVGNEPEVRYVNDGVAVAKISLATSESYTNKQGERVDNTEWHNVVLWRGLAKVVEDYVTKGMRLYIEGKITYRSYERDGETKYITEIVASELKLLTKKSESTSSSSSPTPKVQQNPVPVPTIDVEPEEGDDLPF